jgi:hypothetical protein
MFIRSRYDILLGRPGVEIIEEPKPSSSVDDEHLIIYGPRRSGRTQALVEDMLNYSRMGNNVCFFSQNQAQSDNVKRQIPHGLLNGRVFFTYNNLRAIRGLDADGLYLDDFIRSTDDFSRRLNFETIKPFFCHNIRIVIASITDVMPFDTQGWTFRELVTR